MIELHRTFHACFEWRVNRAVLAVPRAEVLLETHGDECAESEQTHVVFLACFHDEVEQVALVFRRNPHFVSQVTGVGHA